MIDSSAQAELAVAFRNNPLRIKRCKSIKCPLLAVITPMYWVQTAPPLPNRLEGTYHFLYLIIGI